MRQSARPASLDRRQRTSLQRPDSGAEATPGLSTRFADVLARTLPAGAPVALLDSPWHGNPGDAAIWKGEMETLAASGHRVVHIASVGNFDRRRFDRLLPADGIVLLHGGGNLGDLWPPHQAHRESLLAELDDRRVVLLPQTVHFDDRQLGHQALRRMSRHPDFTVMARDARSLECLRSAGLDAHLSEDPASVLRFDRSPPAASRSGPSVLRLLRSDCEGRVTLPRTLTAGAQDWSDLGVVPQKSLTVRALLAAERVQRAAGRAAPASDRPRQLRFHRQCDRIVARATAAIRAHDVIVTDRLHGVLLALAVGRPVVALDTGYGKIDSYAETFLTDEPLLHRPADPYDVDEVVAEIQRNI